MVPGVLGSTERCGRPDDTLFAMRFFNTEGPVVARKHYCIPPLERVNIAELLVLIAQERYFVLHAPRQTGKTSVLLALRDLLEAGGAGDYRCVYVNVEAAQAVREDVERAMRVILGEMGDSALFQGDGFLDGIWSDILARFGDRALGAALARWCQADPKPLVLLIDEIDTLIGDTLIAVLRQLRAGYVQRPGGFPQSVVLCGVRDVRDYRIHSSTEQAVVTGGSAFNIRAESLRLGDFTEAEVRALIAQHTEETGQAFTAEALETVWAQTLGQPWLVNALCARACFGDEAGRDRSRAITAEAVMAAREHLVQSRQVHLDQLADKLQEERVRRVVEPLLSGGGERASTARDIEYVRDLGLIARDDTFAHRQPRLRGGGAAGADLGDPAVAARRDGLVRRCGRWPGRGQAARCVPVVLPRALRALAGPVRLRGGGSAAHPARIPAAGGERRRAHRARVRTGPGADRPAHRVAARWSGGGTGATVDRYVVECKVLHRSLERTVAEGVEQTAAYMDRCDARAGHLVVFDRQEGRTWEEKVFRREERIGERAVTVWGM